MAVANVKQTGDGDFDTGQVKVTWIKIMPNTDRPLDGTPTMTTRRVFFGGESDDLPPMPVYGYFPWDANSVDWLKLMVESVDSGHTITVVNTTNAPMSLEFQHHYVLFKGASTPTFVIDPANQTNVHLYVDDMHA